MVCLGRVSKGKPCLANLPEGSQKIGDKGKKVEMSSLAFCKASLGKPCQRFYRN